MLFQEDAEENEHQSALNTSGNTWCCFKKIVSEIREISCSWHLACNEWELLCSLGKVIIHVILQACTEIHSNDEEL